MLAAVTARMVAGVPGLVVEADAVAVPERTWVMGASGNGVAAAPGDTVPGRAKQADRTRGTLPAS